MTTSTPLLFEGKTSIHLGENHTIQDMVDECVNIMSANELYGFKLVLDMYLKSPEFKIKEAKDKAFWDRFKKDEEL